MTNLYTFLWRLLVDSAGGPSVSITLTEEEREFIMQYVKEPDTQILFKAKRVGGSDDNPQYAQDYQIAGEPLEVFCLLTEAMMANGQLADLMISAVQFYLKHVPSCPKCREAVNQARRNAENKTWDWTFLKHKPLTDEQERAVEK